MQKQINRIRLYPAGFPEADVSRVKSHISHTRIIAAGFILMILAGTLLLSLPIASADGQATPFGDALFTSVSASCVTGLVVVDTATHWSLFGQAVILVLIQTGGLGVMTFVTLIFIVLGKRIGLRERQLMTESINASKIGGIVAMTRRIITGTVFFELTGAALLAVRFIPRFGAGKGIWLSVFHSISAFCNAGFDLLGEGNEYISFCDYAADPLVVITLSVLITAGGVGFLVWDDVWKHGLKVRKYRLQTKVVLAATLILTFGGTLLFFIFESGATGAGKTFGVRVLEALFDAITPRTAGFNTTDTAALSAPSTVLTYIYMFIGGSSGSTAGGVKTTSVAVLLAFAIAGARRKQYASLFGRSLPEDSLKQAIYAVSGNLLSALAAAMAVGAIQPLPLKDLLFECFSAIGTVGMTTGITRSLLPASQLIICLLMLIGRVGSVSFALAVMEKRARPQVSFPTESINVG